ncbi:uncharacterized protein LOC141623795 [Silene latifolia]|uniref:uncharacterized protein LOC141623795 n=1 Tax=Silene latifolia TaxID=37657 RepID=UPI003D78902A
MAAAVAANKVERAHQLYREGLFAEALELYSIALSFAKTTPQRIALHSNRAACFLKLHNFTQASEECTSVLELDHRHTGALMLRAQTLVTLKEYQSALFDVNRLLELNPSSEVYLDLQTRLKTQLSLAPIPEEEEEDDDTSEDVVERDKNSEDSDWLQKAEDTSVKHERKDVDENISFGPNGSPLSSDSPSNGWREIEKPKGHSKLDYSRWDSVDDGSSDDDDDDDDDSDEETQPRYKFRFKTVDLKHVK